MRGIVLEMGEMMGPGSRLLVVVVALAVITGGGILSAQGTTYEVVSNPYQHEYDFAVGADLTPNVEIANVRWRLLRLDIEDDVTPVEGEETKAIVTVEVENTSDRSAKFSLILLLEDERGGQLERVELKTFRAASGRFDSDEQKIKIDGGTLQRLGKVYVLVQVS